MAKEPFDVDGMMTELNSQIQRAVRQVSVQTEDLRLLELGMKVFYAGGEVASTLAKLREQVGDFNSKTMDLDNFVEEYYESDAIPEEVSDEGLENPFDERDQT